MSEKYNPTYRGEYVYHNPWGNPKHMWKVVLAGGGIHLYVADMGENYNPEYGERYSGGIEIHYRHPPSYMDHEPPSHDECFLLKAPCWHDGSSLQASEYWIPLWLTDPHNHERMFHLLAQYFNKRRIDG